MRSVASASGSSVISSAKRLFICVIFAYINFLVSYYVGEPVKTFFTSLLTGVKFLNVPFAGLVVVEGALYVFLISLSYRIAGSPYGIVTAVLTISFFLLMGPWCGVLKPFYFSIFGFLSFILMGVLVERVNGGVANLAFGLVNWCAATVCSVSEVAPLGVIVFGICAFGTGLAADYAARGIAKLVGEPLARLLD